MGVCNPQNLVTFVLAKSFNKAEFERINPNPRGGIALEGRATAANLERRSIVSGDRDLRQKEGVHVKIT